MIDVRTVRYPFHPWFGREVFVFTHLSWLGQPILRCRLDLEAPRGLDIPLWMFDEATCATMGIKSQPAVSFHALRRLRQVLDTRRTSLIGVDEQHPSAPRIGDADEQEDLLAAPRIPETSPANGSRMADTADVGSTAGDSTPRPHASHARPQTQRREQGGPL